IEPDLQAPGIVSALDLVEAAKHRATERRGAVIAPRRKRRFPPEIEAVDVAVREIHRALMRLVAIVARDLRRHRIAARDDGALRAPNRVVGGFGDRRLA